MKREQLGSRLGFIMLSAGCAIGCGNVWKFPWMCGQNGGGSFIGSAIAVIFAPLGFDTWQAVASSLSGFVAKEGIVSTMGWF